jgi:hypothetical protein
MLGVSTSQETYQSGADADSIVTGVLRPLLAGMWISMDPYLHLRERNIFWC